MENLNIPKLNEREKEPIKWSKVRTQLIVGLAVIGMFYCTSIYLTQQVQEWNSKHGLQSPIIFRSPVYDKQTNEPEKVSEVIIPKVEAKAPFCFDPITCIRDVGDELGFSNKDILIAINIAKKESGMNPSALNKNKNGSFDVGLMQINDVHGKRISREDRMNYEKNIRFAYQLRKEQGSWNAWSTCHNGMVDCN